MQQVLNIFFVKRKKLNESEEIFFNLSFCHTNIFLLLIVKLQQFAVIQAKLYQWIESIRENHFFSRNQYMNARAYVWKVCGIAIQNWQTVAGWFRVVCGHRASDSSFSTTAFNIVQGVKVLVVCPFGLPYCINDENCSTFKSKKKKELKEWIGTM